LQNFRRTAAGKARAAPVTFSRQTRHAVLHDARRRGGVGKNIVTVEGTADEKGLHRVQQAFLDEDAMQCGYCISCMLISAVALLADAPNPSDAEIRDALAPHLCRCSMYLRAIRAVKRAAH
jgi:nicotinate dehydrogenase subunit A